MTLAAVDRYDSDRISERASHAVVVGGSMTGLCVARVLADAFERVTVVERDDLPDEPVARDGAPQTSQPHVMLEAGRATLEDLFPGFGERLLSAGGLMVDAMSTVEWYDQGGFLADAPERVPMYASSRALIEHVVRQAVAARDDVHLRDGCRVTRYRTTDDSSRVTGVAVRDGGGVETTLSAALVVDATGRTSRTPAWLDDHGYERPPVDEVAVDVTYSTVRIERPPDDRRVFFVPPSAPRTRGGVVVPIEDGQWEVVLQGVNGDETPTESGAFVDFAESLPVAEVSDLVSNRPWTADISHYPFPSSVRRRYWDLDRFPDGLVVTGDAIASFNPVYGQGMSVGALNALVLHHTLAADGLDEVAGRFFDRIEPVVDDVWQLAVGADFDFAGTTGPKPTGTDVFNRYFDRLVRQAHTDPVVREALSRVLLLEKPPTTLLRPAVVWRALTPGDAGPLQPLTSVTSG